MSKIQEWRDRVESHHAQSERAIAEMGDDGPDGDFWKPLAANFRDDPRRSGDEVVDRLLREVTADSTILDVGGGAGRLALPLALHSRHVTVVEPSESMVKELYDVAGEHGIDNVSVVKATWEDADVEPADIVLCSHVIYGVADAEPFVRKLTDHTKKKVLLLAFMDAPQARLAPIWEPIHGEERIDLPALPELLAAMWDMDIFPDVEMLTRTGLHSFDDRESALDQLRRRLYVVPGSQKDARLKVAMKDLVYESPDGLAVKGSKPRRLGLLSWGPEGPPE